MQNMDHQNGCGPADVVQVWRNNHTMRVLLKKDNGKSAEAIYRGCVYQRLGRQEEGIRLSGTRRVSARELLEEPRSVSVLALQKRTHNVAQLLHDWENRGLSLYVLQGKASYMEFLVVCQSMEYREQPSAV